MKMAQRMLAGVMLVMGISVFSPSVNAHVTGSDQAPYTDYVSCYVTTDKSLYSEGNQIVGHVFCQNKTKNQIVIRGTQVGGVGIVYGHDRIWRTDGFYWGPATGDHDDFQAGRYLCPGGQPGGGALSFNQQYVKDNGYTIRLPARSTVRIATALIQKTGSQCATLEAGRYLVEMGLHRIETSAGVFKDIFMSAPIKIVP